MMEKKDKSKEAEEERHEKLSREELGDDVMEREKGGRKGGTLIKRRSCRETGSGV